ncbi:MAG: tocopherol cyclase family protein [Phototrophicaceae bacterium]
MNNYIKRVMNPVWYHGHDKKPPFFEGWYFKCVTADERQKWAFIPGIFKNKEANKSHAFVQVLDGNNGSAYYHRYSVDDFQAKDMAFDVQLGKNRFQIDHIQFDIDDDLGKITGDLRFIKQNPWEISLFAPGVMGPFGWLPFLECYHGICSLDHSIEGSLNIYGNEIDFSGGRGYIEKDWGQSFPTGYIWQQSNHFESVGTSLTASFATVPNVGRTFAGFIVGLWHGGQLYPFTTYNGTKIEYVRVTDEQVRWALQNRQYRLEVEATRAEGGLLLGPEREDMHKRVDETLKSTIQARLIERSNKRVIFEGNGRNAALEVVGDLSMIVKK